MVWQSLVAACALLSRSVLVDWRALVQHLVPRAPMYPFSYSGRALHISIRYEPNNTGWVISCPASTSNSNSTARLADLFSVASIQTPSGVFHIWRHNDIFPIAGLGTYISGVGIHLQLRGLIPSIGTHRRLANLDSFVNHHTPGIFGLGRSPRSHRSSISGALLRWRSTRISSGTPCTHYLTTRVGAHFSGLHSTFALSIFGITGIECGATKPAARAMNHLAGRCSTASRIPAIVGRFSRPAFSRAACVPDFDKRIRAFA